MRKSREIIHPMLSLNQAKNYKIEKMELKKVKCYECGSEYPVPADMPICHCRECRSPFVENIPLSESLSGFLD